MSLQRIHPEIMGSASFWRVFNTVGESKAFAGRDHYTFEEWDRIFAAADLENILAGATSDVWLPQSIWKALCMKHREIQQAKKVGITSKQYIADQRRLEEFERQQRNRDSEAA